MTNEEAIKNLKDILIEATETENAVCYVTSVDADSLKVAIKALEQKPSEDVMAIHTQGLAEGIRCAMCTNSMKNDRGCDGGCVVDDAMYKEIMEVINKQMFELSTSNEPITSQPKMGRCKDCKYFEYNSFAIVNNMPLIVAHEICSKWGNGCKTREDGHCFLFEPQSESEDK